MNTRQLIFVFSPLFAACYGVPMESNLQIEVTPREASPTADGQGLADVRITPSQADAVFRRMVSVQASSGRFLSPEAPAEGPATLTRLAPAEGPIELVLRYGRTPGPLVVEARREEALAGAVLDLGLRGPDRIELEATPRRLVADGRDQARLTVELAAEPPAQVSAGAAVHFAVCCEGEQGLQPCPGGAPVRVPSTLTLEDPSSPLEADVVAAYEARTSTVVEERQVWLRATTRASMAPCLDGMQEVSAELAFTLTPVDG